MRRLSPICTRLRLMQMVPVALLVAACDSADPVDPVGDPSVSWSPPVRIEEAPAGLAPYGPYPTSFRGDSFGNLHLLLSVAGDSILSRRNRRLVYVAFDGQRWAVEAEPTAWGLFEDASVSVDATGIGHLVWSGVTSQNLDRFLEGEIVSSHALMCFWDGDSCGPAVEVAATLNSPWMEFSEAVIGPEGQTHLLIEAGAVVEHVVLSRSAIVSRTPMPTSLDKPFNAPTQHFSLARTADVLVSAFSLNRSPESALMLTSHDGGGWSQPRVAVRDSGLVLWSQITVADGRWHVAYVLQSEDASIWAVKHAFSTDSGANWSEPTVVFEYPDITVREPQLVTDGKQAIHLVWSYFDVIGVNVSTKRTMWSTLSDETWTTPEVLFPDTDQLSPIRVTAANGSIHAVFQGRSEAVMHSVLR